MNEYDILNKDNMKNGIFLKIFLFLVVGGITLLIDTSISYILYHNIHLPAFLASGIGFLSGFVFNFPVNRKKVFNHSQYDRFSLKIQITLYTLLSLFNLVATSSIIATLVNSNVLDIQWAKVVVTAVFAIWNFLVFNLFIFSKNNDKNVEIKNGLF
ncbi:GtrA family protein [Candidatus Nanosynbacter sp. HMT-352]|jgi:hypothetical protein cdiviTM7_01485|uniref:GtrA family protein n=1 Tax=Candidatus Nanosynbacter sp. HMT-352 TaxID=2899133 RepID=UPI001E4B65E8|nr:GtrA family protein [Candidatus Nanosynbacter sp. HMT-352]UHA57315.1 GtrA family protein [Candidatus Nanosynbacter sp. HMT-352]